MQSNLKLGFTRLYLVLWAVWFAVVLLRTLSTPPIVWVSDMAMNLAAAAFISGIVAPALLFLGFRWVLAGFFPGAPTSNSGQA